MAEREQERDDADREEAGGLEAGVAVARRANVQCRFHQKLFVTATTKASVAATRWWTPSELDAQREDAQVDDVAGRRRPRRT